MSQSMNDQVAANHLYGGAWNEVNTRLAQRQNLLSMYTYLIVPTLIASFIEEGTRPHWRVVYLVPVFSLFFAWLFRMHTTELLRLRRYLQDLEFLGTGPQPTGFHARESREHGTVSPRAPSRHVDFYTMPVITFVFFGFCNVLAGVLLWRKQEFFERMDFSGMIASAIIGLAALALVLPSRPGRGRADGLHGLTPDDVPLLRKLRYLDLRASNSRDRQPSNPS